MLFVQKTAKGVRFLDSTVHKQIPKDAAPITKVRWKQALAAQSRGATLDVKAGRLHLSDHTGKTIDPAADHYSAAYGAPPTLADLARSAERTASAYVTETWLVVGDPVPEVWSNYIKALRAIRDGVNTNATTLPPRP